MTFDKFVLNNYLRGFGVKVANSLLLRRGEQYSEADIEAKIGMPCFVKPAADGSSFGVSKVKNSDQLAPALRVAFMESNEVMIEGFLDGVEISQGIYKTKNKSVVSLLQRSLQTMSSLIMMLSITVRYKKLLQPALAQKLLPR